MVPRAPGIRDETQQRRPRREAAARTAERIERAQQRIAEAVAGIQSGVEWRDYLRLQSRLHAYSGANTLLVWRQHAEAYEQGLVRTPWPTYVAGFHTWKALGRFVEKGQHGYEILAPKHGKTRFAVDASGSERRLGCDEEPHPGERVDTRPAIQGFKIEHVFALEQTQGAPIAEPPTPTLLQGAAPAGLWDSVTSQIHDRGYRLEMVPDADTIGGANGLTRWDAKTVQVRADMDEAARVKTALHELAHCLLHEPATLTATYRDRPRPSRGAIEVEAESVAFIVADAHHMSTDDYSFPYVAVWAGPDGADVVQASTQRVATAARQIIAASPAEHATGGRVPGVERALAARQDRQRPERRYAAPAPPAPTITLDVAG